MGAVERGLREQQRVVVRMAVKVKNSRRVTSFGFLSKYYSDLSSFIKSLTRAIYIKLNSLVDRVEFSRKGIEHSKTSSSKGKDFSKINAEEYE